MENVRLISSECGGNLIVFNSHKYRLIRLRKDNIEKWTCTNKCTASLLIENIGENKFIFRITNAAESFHRTFNRQFYSMHPPVYAVIKTLLETQEENSFKT
jgi:ribosomal protein L18